MTLFEVIGVVLTIVLLYHVSKMQAARHIKLETLDDAVGSNDDM